MHTEMTRFKFKRPDIKPLAERNRFVVGLVGIAVLVAAVVAAFSYDKIPFVKGTSDYSAYFAEAGGIKPGSDVRVSGMSVGRVSDVKLDGTKVLVDFTVRNGVELGDRTEAAIKAETVLGTKMLEITPRGDGELTGTIPLERTKSPYDLPTALGDLTTTISGLDTTQLSQSLTTLADTFKDTPPELRIALEGVARFSDTLNTRDAQLRNLLADANKVTAVLGKRSDQIAKLVVNANLLLGEILTQRDSIDALMNNLDVGIASDIRAGGRQPHATQACAGQTQRCPGDPGQPKEGTAAHALSPPALRDVVRRGAGRRAVLQGIAGQPRAWAVLPAVHRRRVLRPRSRPQHDAAVGSRRPGRRPARHAGAADALPAHRAGRRSSPDAAGRDHRQPRRSGCGPPGLPLPGPTGCYPYREPLPAPPPGGPPPGPPAVGPAAGELPPPTIPPPNPAAAEGGPPANPADAEAGQR